MAIAALAPEVVLWTDTLRVALVGRVLKRMQPAVRLIGLGGPRSTPVADLARDLQCPLEDDFRKLLVEHPATFVLLTTMEGAAREDVGAALAQGSIVLTTEPIIADFDSLASNKGRMASGAIGRVVNTPAFLRTPGWAGADPVEVLGAARLISFFSFGTSDECSLLARLYDAWQVVLSLGQLPDSIDASLIGPLTQAPESLRAMTGHIASHARLPGGGAAVLEVSDLAGHAARRLRVIGDDARVRIGDADYQLFDVENRLIDEKPAPAEPLDFAELIATDWRRLLNRPPASTEPPGPDEAQVLSCCMACLLSARTGQPESPEKLLALHRRA